MRSPYLKILGVVAVFSMLAAFSVFAGPSSVVMDRSITPTGDIQYYYALHGVDQNLTNMVYTELKNEMDLYGDPATISMRLGKTIFTLADNNLVALEITTPDSNGTPTTTTENIG